jgi:hypothetical protein
MGCTSTSNPIRLTPNPLWDCERVVWSRRHALWDTGLPASQTVLAALTATAFFAMAISCPGDLPARPPFKVQRTAVADSDPGTVCNRDGVNALGSLGISPQ